MYLSGRRNVMLNEALRLIRVYHDVRQSEMAEKLGISKSYLSEIEHDRKRPTLDLVEKYAEIFKIPVSWARQALTKKQGESSLARS
jgi:transcriptional regulator with XRE-family HTH domain